MTGNNTWVHPKTRATYQIVNPHKDGGFRTSKGLLKLLKEGNYDLIDGSDYLYNADTGRLVEKQVYMTKQGGLRSKHTTDGWAISDRNKNVIEKPVATKLNAKADVKYQGALASYKRPRTTEQDKISRDINAKIIDMKEAGRIEIEGTPQQMIEQLKQLDRPHVSYVTKTGLYRAGGFLRKINPELEYIALANPSVGLSFSVDLNNVKAMYCKAMKMKVPPLVETTQAPTKFSVAINGVTVGYFKDNYKKTRFMASKKYKAMVDAYAKEA